MKKGITISYLEIFRINILKMIHLKPDPLDWKPIIAFFLWVISVISIGCSDDNYNNVPDVFDSIPLYYSYIDTSCIDLNQDLANDIIVEDTSWYWIYGLEYFVGYGKKVKSLNPSVSISVGNTTDEYYYVLDKDSVIDESLVWTNKFLIQGNGQNFYIDQLTEYVGIRYLHRGQFHYGWIYMHDPNRFTDYAIDTTWVAIRKVKAGKEKK